jgi:hypothetical protein
MLQTFLLDHVEFYGVVAKRATTAIGRRGTTLFEEVQRQLFIEGCQLSQPLLAGRRLQPGSGIAQADCHGEVIAGSGQQRIDIIQLHESFPFDLGFDITLNDILAGGDRN